MKDLTTITVTKQRVALFVDRSRRQWIVRDAEGALWTVPAADDGWERRRPYEVSDPAALEPAPGHYKNLLGLPF